MEGIQFLVDDKGRKKAVLIDLAKWGEVWEDLQDILVSQARKHEPTVPWETLKAEMDRAGRKRG